MTIKKSSLYGCQVRHSPQVRTSAKAWLKAKVLFGSQPSKVAFSSAKRPWMKLMWTVRLWHLVSFSIQSPMTLISSLLWRAENWRMGHPLRKRIVIEKKRNKSILWLSDRHELAVAVIGVLGRWWSWTFTNMGGRKCSLRLVLGGLKSGQKLIHGWIVIPSFS